MFITHTSHLPSFIVNDGIIACIYMLASAFENVGLNIFVSYFKLKREEAKKNKFSRL